MRVRGTGRMESRAAVGSEMSEATSVRERRPDTLFGSGYLLVGNAILTSVVGIAYWACAARLYPAQVVGKNTSIISAMMLLGGLAQLNLMNVLLRFVPIAGRRARRIVAAAYAVGSGLAGLAALGFVAGLRWWAPELGGLLHGVPQGAAFVVACMCWSVFVMQDGTLVAVGRTAIVPLENLAFAVLKVALLVALAGLLPGSGIWVAWTAASLLVVGTTSGYLFIRIMPEFAAAGQNAREPTLHELRGYFGMDLVGASAWIAANSLTPLIVLDLTGATAAAAFGLAFSVGSSLYAVPAAFGQSLVAHGVSDPTALDDQHRRVRRRTLLVVVAAAAILVAFAPQILDVFGPVYAAEGAMAMRLLALSAIPNIVVALAVSRARARSQMRTVVASLGALCALVIVLAVLLLPLLGVTGAGLAWLVAESVVAAVLLVAERRHVRRAPAVISPAQHFGTRRT